MTLEVTGPDRVSVGSAVTYRIRALNRGRESIRRATLRCELAPGLSHSHGREIWAELGDLAPGQVRTEALTVQADRPGYQIATLSVAAEGGHRATAQSAVQVGGPPGEPRLVLRLDGPQQGTVGQVMTFRIELCNTGPAEAPEGRVTQVLPEGVDFIAAEVRGRYCSSTRSIDWDYPRLPPGKKHTSTFQVRGLSSGNWALITTCRSGGLPELRSFRALRLAGSEQALELEVTMSNSPILVGEEAVSLIRVYNPGPSQVSNVRLTVDLPEGLTPIRADGPTRAKAIGGSVEYEVIAVVPPRSEAIYRLHLRADRPGAGALRASAVSAGKDSPACQVVIVKMRPQ